MILRETLARSLGKSITAVAWRNGDMSLGSKTWEKGRKGDRLSDTT